MPIMVSEVDTMRLMTIPEVSDLLRVPRARAYELAREGLIPVVRVGRQVRVSDDALSRWIESGGTSLPKDRAQPDRP